MALPIAQRHLRSAILVTLVAVAGYVLLLGGLDPAAAFGALAAVPVGVWAAILGLSLFNYGLRWMRWHWLLRHGGHAVPAGRSLSMYVAGFAFTATPAKAGEAVRAAYLRGEGVPVARTLSLLYLERWLDGVAVALLTIGAIGLWTGSALQAMILVGVFASLVMAMGSRRVMMALRRYCEARSGRVTNWLAELLAGIETLLRPRLLAGGIALGVVAWGAEGVGLALILWALAAEVPLELAIGIYAAAMLGGAATLLPGGLGGAEAVMVTGLVQAGAGAGVASAATVICRVATLWFAVLLGAFAVAGLALWSPRVETEPSS
jgi:glycosyltransferase 2 family protein